MTFAEYEDYDALGLAELVRTRQLSAGELLEAALERAEAHNPSLNAIVHFFPDLARELIAMGLPAGPFAGVPFLLKNTGTALAGAPVTSGSDLFRNAVAPADSTLARRQKAAGLLPFGRTNVPEFALSFTTEPAAFGVSRNPWNVLYSPGGSSGGSAAAVAAGIVPLAHSSDGAGSTRLPAAHCGVFGFKPSRMRNPLGPDIVEGIAGMSTPHAVSWSVRDSAALLDATSGPDVGDPAAAPLPTRPFLSEVERDPRPLRIGLVLDSPLGTAVDPACKGAAVEAARLCESLGHGVEDALPDYDAHALKHAWRVIAGVNLVQQVSARARVLALADPSSFIEPVNRQWLAEGARWLGVDYLAAVGQLHRAARAMGRFFARYDILLSPTTGEPPPLLGDLAGAGRGLDDFYDRFWEHGPFTCVFNASGCPAMSVPWSLTGDGLPVGVHFGAAFGAEGLLFSLAGSLERARPWRNRRPQLNDLSRPSAVVMNS